MVETCDQIVMWKRGLITFLDLARHEPEYAMKVAAGRIMELEAKVERLEREMKLLEDQIYRLECRG